MIVVAGAGAFGTGLAVSLAQNGPVTLWARDSDHASDMQETRENAARLPGVHLDENIMVTSETEVFSKAEIVLLAVPTQKLGGFLETYASQLGAASMVACCKGIELTSGLRPTAVIESRARNAKTAMLTGPSFAADIAKGLPTALTLACAEDNLGRHLQQRLTTPNIRLYRTSDVVGAELGGALKNVIAIACGASDGAALGESARAALMTRGFAEMTRIAAAQGARPETMAGLSGFGDLTLTCTSAQSRNYQYGVSLGRGNSFDAAVTVEGAATSRALVDWAEKNGIDVPITRVVTGLVNGELQVGQAMHMLLSRPLKEE